MDVYTNQHNVIDALRSMCCIHPADDDVAIDTVISMCCIQQAACSVSRGRELEERGQWPQ